MKPFIFQITLESIVTEHRVKFVLMNLGDGTAVTGFPQKYFRVFLQRKTKFMHRISTVIRCCNGLSKILYVMFCKENACSSIVFQEMQRGANSL